MFFKLPIIISTLDSSNKQHNSSFVILTIIQLIHSYFKQHLRNKKGSDKRCFVKEEKES